MAKFRNLSKLGSGGYGEVWLAEDVDTGIKYAKKVLKEDSNAEAVARFQKEIRLLWSLSHPNIIEIVTFELNEPPYCYWMPLYESNLFHVLNNSNWDCSRIKEIFAAILDGMEYAHSQGVVHRDLKPENVLISAAGGVVISDFGLGRQINALTTRLTGTGEVGGTFLFAAPEQVRGLKGSDERSDIYALGRMLCELHGCPLVVGTQDLALHPGRIRMIVNKCTRQNPADRYQSVTELKEDWKSLFEAVLHSSSSTRAMELWVRDVLTREEAKELLEILQRDYLDEEDALHEFLIKCTTGAVVMMHTYDSQSIQEVIRKFVEFTSRTEWDFDYTDRIGRWCSELFFAIKDHDVRTDLALCVLCVGASHNRFHVIGLLQDIFESMHDIDESMLMRQKLEKVRERHLDAVTQYLKLSKLPKDISEVFRRRKEPMKE